MGEKKCPFLHTLYVGISMAFECIFVHGMHFDTLLQLIVKHLLVGSPALSCHPQKRSTVLLVGVTNKHINIAAGTFALGAFGGNISMRSLTFETLSFLLLYEGMTQRRPTTVSNSRNNKLLRNYRIQLPSRHGFGGTCVKHLLSSASWLLEGIQSLLIDNSPDESIFGIRCVSLFPSNLN